MHRGAKRGQIKTVIKTFYLLPVRSGLIYDNCSENSWDGMQKTIEDLAKSGGLENGTFPQNLLIFLLCRQPPELSEGYHLVSEIIKFLTSPQIVSRPVFPPSLVRSRQTATGSIANNFTIHIIMAGWSLTNKHLNNLNI